jgi:hypothetical protein
MDWRGVESKRIVEPFYLPHTKGRNLPRRNEMEAGVAETQRW